MEKAGMIAMVKMRLLDTDDSYALRGSTLDAAMIDDRSNGLIPFFVSLCTGRIKSELSKFRHNTHNTKRLHAHWARLLKNYNLGSR